MAPPKPPSPGKDDLEKVLARTERVELFDSDEWERNKDNQAFLSLQVPARSVLLSPLTHTHRH